MGTKDTVEKAVFLCLLDEYGKRQSERETKHTFATLQAAHILPRA